MNIHYLNLPPYPNRWMVWLIQQGLAWRPRCVKTCFQEDVSARRGWLVYRPYYIHKLFFIRPIKVFNYKELFGNEHESSPPLSLDHYFKIVCSQKLIRSLAGIAVYITFSWNALTSISLLVALVIKGLIIRGAKCKKKNPQWYMMAMWSMRKHKFIDQLSCKISEIVKKKWPTGSHFGFFSVKSVMGYPCVRHYILFYIHGPVILHFLS